MKKVQYIVGKNESIVDIPGGAVIDVYLVYKDDTDAIIYIPRKVKWILPVGYGETERGTSYGCGCLSFAHKTPDPSDPYWGRNRDDFINLSNGGAMKFEKKIKKK
jgi:hypothetical protein